MTNIKKQGLHGFIRTRKWRNCIKMTLHLNDAVNKDKGTNEIPMGLLIVFV